ncbi:hypothetical protein LCL97_00445 [Seohaeicola saemankumensis]|nr:hypothetical protein [Seohaeicola saemankumensis]MCA0869281.1 hypothetical protein [Seohaeicola saemankumensis]
MRVKIDHSEKKIGLLRRRKFYCVTIEVDFSEEERQIIRERRLKRDVVLERKPSAELAVYENDPPEKFWLLISDLLKGPDTWMANSVLDAKQYADEVENLMPTLKGYIVGNTEIEQKSKTLEF